MKTIIVMASAALMMMFLFVNTVTATKRGYCPSVALDQMGICVDECGVDADCIGSQKCCRNGCGHTCQRAISSKPGDCPAIDEDNILCVKGTFLCKTDMDCYGMDKCCWTGCTPLCMKPAPREGKCPVVASDTMGACVQECDEDHSCEWPKKCCSNGCGKTCQMPEVPKPGICPAVEEGMMGICVEGCSSDGDCQGGEKCCSNGCGHACKKPANDTCFVNGKYYLPGASVPDPDGCNNCFCGGMGQLGCTLMACYCEVNGESISMGQTYPAEDGCNTCTCKGDRGHERDSCTDYICDTGPGSPLAYMNTGAVVTACLGGIGLIITIIALVATYCICKKNNKKKGKVMSVDQTHLVEADAIPPKA